MGIKDVSQSEIAEDDEEGKGNKSQQIIPTAYEEVKKPIERSPTLKVE